MHKLLGNFQANRVVSPKFYTVRKNFTGPPVPPVPTNLKSGDHHHHHYYHQVEGRQGDGGEVDEAARGGRRHHGQPQLA